MATQLVDINDYNPVDRMIFSNVEHASVPNSNPRIDYKRITISSRNTDGTIGDLILPTSRLYSFGVSEGSESMPGFSIPLCLFSKDGPAKEELDWVNLLDEIVYNCIDYLVTHREKIERYDLEKRELDRLRGGLNPLYWKVEKATDNDGKVFIQRVPGVGPILYVKLIHQKKNNVFISKLYDHVTDEEVDPRSLIGKGVFIKAAIKIESIFIGSKISIQVKLHEAMVENIQHKVTRLL